MSFVINPFVFAGAPFSPADISGLQLWLDATTGLYDATSGGSEVTADGASVARWEDQSGNGYHVTQGTANDQPVLKTSQQNSLNIVRFDGVNDFLFGSTNFPITGSSNRTVFTVFKRVDGAARYIASWGLATSVGVFSGYSSEYYLRFSSTIKGYTNQGANGQWTLWSVVGDGSTLNDYNSYFDDGGIATSNTSSNTGATINTTATALYIGRASFFRLAYQDGDMAEVLIYDSALSDADREAVRDYLNAKWAIY